MFQKTASLLPFFFIGLLAFAYPPYAKGEPDLQRFDDAGIHAIQFFDDNEGWAAGEMGTIWHTIDGGKNWERQATGLRASLKSMHFLNPYLGWVVGTEYQPALGNVGVVLLTRDGGIKWQKVMHNTFPGLFLVRFQDQNTGYMAGAGTEAYPSGVFKTTDGGKSWQAMEGPRTTVWQGGVFNPGETPLLAGAWNRFATVAADKVIHQNNENDGTSIRSLHQGKDKKFAVGTGGLVLSMEKSSPGTWARENLQFPSEALRICDFNAAGGSGNHVWIGGSPGSFLLHSPDGGKIWKPVHLPTSATIHSIFFHDEKRGWVAGDLGTILATQDGGQTWKVQRRGGQRSKELLFSATRNSLIPELTTLLGFENNFLVTQILLAEGRPGASPLSHALHEDMTRFASRNCGAAATESTGILPSLDGLLIANPKEAFQHWDNLLGTSSADLLIRKICAYLRAAQPETVVLCETEINPTLMEAILRHACLDAVEKAGNKDYFSDQTEYLGLKPWKVKKVLLAAKENGAGVLFHTRQSLNAIETSPSDFCEPFRRLLMEKTDSPAVIALRMLSPAGFTGKFQDLFDPSVPGLDARKAPELQPLSKEQESAIRQSAMIRNLLDQPLGKNSHPGMMISRLNKICEHMPENQAARLLGNLGKQLTQQGQWPLAKEVFETLCLQFPTTNEAAEAAKWLVFHDASSEARRRHELGQFIGLIHHEFGVPRENPSGGVGQDSNPVQPRGIPIQIPNNKRANPLVPPLPKMEARHQGEIQTMDGAKEAKARLQKALERESKLSLFGPLMEKDPRVFFAAQASRRNLGQIKEAQEKLEEFLAGSPTGVWKTNALMENWLVNRKGLPPKPVYAVKRITSKPYLDGKLDEEIWSSATKAILKTRGGTPDSGWETTALMAFDPEYLFLGIHCKRIEDPAKEFDTQTDQVIIQFDLDRDYTTCFQLQIDAQGRVRNSCWGDETWSPRWFASVDKTETGWTLEAAIPVSLLANSPLTPGKAWAGNFTRKIAGKDTQGWSHPLGSGNHAEENLEGMGLLIFGSITPQKGDSVEPASFKPSGP